MTRQTRTKRIFGPISGYDEGHIFPSRHDLSVAGVHRPPQAGISGSQEEGADSIVLSGGYEDDEDYGDLIVYTGHGGRDEETSQQVSDQLLRYQNLALAKNSITGLPVRVIRGHGHRSRYAPQFGYRYDGLYRVDSYWRERGKSGYYVWRYRLVKLSPSEVSLPEAQDMQLALEEEKGEYNAAPRTPVIVQRIVRDSVQAQEVKELYEYHCQVCGIRLDTPAGPYAEAAHIQPLGAPHNGPDRKDNILCLCPNHHVLFDYGMFTIADDLSLIGLSGALTVKPGHKPHPTFLHYHRSHFYRGI